MLCICVVCSVLVWLSSLIVCRQVPQNNFMMRLKTLLFAPHWLAPHPFPLLLLTHLQHSQPPKRTMSSLFISVVLLLLARGASPTGRLSHAASLCRPPPSLCRLLPFCSLPLSCHPSPCCPLPLSCRPSPLFLAGKVADTSATCRPDSQKSALLADSAKSCRHKFVPNTFFCVRDCQLSPNFL